MRAAQQRPVGAVAGDDLRQRVPRQLAEARNQPENEAGAAVQYPREASGDPELAQHTPAERREIPVARGSSVEPARDNRLRRQAAAQDGERDALTSQRVRQTGGIADEEDAPTRGGSPGPHGDGRPADAAHGRVPEADGVEVSRELITKSAPRIASREDADAH